MAFHEVLKGKSEDIGEYTIEESPLFPCLFPHYLLGVNISPQSTVWVEESLSAQHSCHCRLLTHHRKYCCVFPPASVQIQDEVKGGTRCIQTSTHFPVKSFRA